MTQKGEFIANPDIRVIKRVLDELDGPPDAEHPDVALSHETGWTLSAFPGGLVVWENVESADEPQHRINVDPEQIFRLWLALADGEFSEVNAFGWSPGYGRPHGDQGL